MTGLNDYKGVTSQYTQTANFITTLKTTRRGRTLAWKSRAASRALENQYTSSNQVKTLKVLNSFRTSKTFDNYRYLIVLRQKISRYLPQ